MEVAQENFNGQVPQNGLALNACDERPLQGSKLMEKAPITDSHADEGQWVYTLEEILGKSEKVIEGDKEKALPLEVTLPHNNNLNITNHNKLPLVNMI